MLNANVAAFQQTGLRSEERRRPVCEMRFVKHREPQMLKKLRRKFVLINMSIVTAMLMIIFCLVYFLTKSNLETESVSMMQTVAENPFALENPGTETTQVQVPYFTVTLNPMGDVIATGGGYYDLSDETFLQEIVEAAFEQTAQTGVLKEYGLRYYKSDAIERTQSLVFADLSYENATLRDLIKTCAIIGVLAFAALLGASILLAGWAVKPVEEAWENQRRFMADASHELKTPLTVIMTNAQMLENEECDETHRRQLNRNIMTMSMQMRELVEKLLEIARVDDGQEHLTFEPVNLSDLVMETTLPFEAVLFEKGFVLDTQIEEGIVVNGSAQHLRRVIEILLDNAGKYTRSNGTISVTLKGAQKKCVLTVSTDGEPLSAAECEAVFGRFYRGDQARSRTGSFGLGLSIAQSTIVRHHGKMWAYSEEGRNSFAAELPVCETK